METKLKTEISLPKWADGHPDPLGVGLLELAHLGGLLHTEVDLVRVLAHNLQLDVLITHFDWKFWLGSEIWKKRKVREDLYLNKISNTKIKTFWIIMNFQIKEILWNLVERNADKNRKEQSIREYNIRCTQKYIEIKTQKLSIFWDFTFLLNTLDMRSLNFYDTKIE